MERRNLLKMIPALIAGLFGVKAAKAAEPVDLSDCHFVRWYGEGRNIEVLRAKTADGPWYKVKGYQTQQELGPDFNLTLDLR